MKKYSVGYAMVTSVNPSVEKMWFAEYSNFVISNYDNIHSFFWIERNSKFIDIQYLQCLFYGPGRTSKDSVISITKPNYTSMVGNKI